MVGQHLGVDLVRNSKSDTINYQLAFCLSLAIISLTCFEVYHVRWESVRKYLAGGRHIQYILCTSVFTFYKYFFAAVGCLYCSNTPPKRLRYTAHLVWKMPPHLLAINWSNLIGNCVLSSELQTAFLISVIISVVKKLWCFNLTRHDLGSIEVMAGVIMLLARKCRLFNSYQPHRNPTIASPAAISFNKQSIFLSPAN